MSGFDEDVRRNNVGDHIQPPEGCRVCSGADALRKTLPGQRIGPAGKGVSALRICRGPEIQPVVGHAKGLRQLLQQHARHRPELTHRQLGGRRGTVFPL